MYLQDIFIFYHINILSQSMTLQPIHQKRLFFPDPVRPDPERTNSKQSKYCRQDQKIDQTSPPLMVLRKACTVYVKGTHP